MNDFVLRFSAILADASIKGFMLLALACAAVLLARRASAATRHLIWTIAAAAVLLLPVLSAVLPHWRIAILPAAVQYAQLAGPIAPLIDIEPVIPAFPGSTFVPETLSSPMAPAAIAPSAWNAQDWITLGVMTWLIGAAAVMFPWLLGALVMGRVGRRARRAPAGVLRSAFDQVRDELSIHRRVLLLIGAETTMPITWGPLRPRVLLPEDARTWPPVRLRAVLLHELAHVKRCDCATQLLGQLACAMYWFNPLVWLMVRRMRAERERACDDVVLARGQGAAAYAEQLVAVARSLRCPRFSRAAAIAMARPSQLRSRVRSILDGTVNRNRMTRGAVLACVVVATLIVVPMAMLRPARAQPAAGTTLPTDSADVNVKTLVDTLEKKRAELRRRIESNDAALREFRAKNPAPDLLDKAQQQLALLSRDYTQAQLHTIEARAKYGDAHPEMLRLREHEAAMSEKYQETLQEVMTLNVAEADYQKLASELEKLKAFEEQLAARVCAR